MKPLGGVGKINRYPGHRFLHLLPFPGPALICALVLLLANPFAVLAETSLNEQITVLARELEAQAHLSQDARALAINFCKSAETWQIVARYIAGRLQAKAALNFLEKALTTFKIESAKTKNIEQTNLVGLNLFYQSTDALAIVLSLYNQDHEALEQIKTSEKRVLGVVGQTKDEEPVMAALTAGIMTMLSVVADQVDPEGRMNGVLTAELELRGKLDQNIGALKDISVQEQWLLLSNNHLNGAFSMMQIIGLTLEPDLKSDLKRLQDRLRGVGKDDLESQLLAAAQTLSQAGFLIAPLFSDLVPTKKDSSASPDGSPSSD